jgi:ABC-type transport system substrate-binding protein
MRVLSPRLWFLGVVVLCLASAGCSTSTSKTGSGSTKTGSAKLVPDPNATVIIESAYQNNFLTDPHTYAGGLTGWSAWTLLYDRLIQLTPDSKALAPMLATSWKWNSTSTQLTMSLRKDVQFQDGSAFNADVAVQNLKAAAQPTSNAVAALAPMTSVVAVDPYTIQLTFSMPDPGVVFTLASYAGIEVSPNGLAHPSTLKTQPAGSGPFKLVSLDASLTFKFDRFDGYWNKSHVYPAHFEEHSVLTETTRLNAIKTGVVDAGAIGAATWADAKADYNLQAVSYLAFTNWSVFMNNKIAPLNDVRVRQAVSLALDRRAFAAAINGQCTPIGQIFPPGMVGYDSSLQPQTNIAQAKDLIQAAGATGAKIKMVTIEFEPWATFGKLVQAQLDAIGLNVQLDIIANGGTYLQLYSQGQYGMVSGATGVSAPDPTAILDTWYFSPFNPGVKDPTEVAKIHQSEQLPLDSSQRNPAFQDVNRDLTTKYFPWVPICQQTNDFAANKKVIGLTSLQNAAFTQDPNWSFLQVAK